MCITPGMRETGCPQWLATASVVMLPRMARIAVGISAVRRNPDGDKCTSLQAIGAAPITARIPTGPIELVDISRCNALSSAITIPEVGRLKTQSVAQVAAERKPPKTNHW